MITIAKLAKHYYIERKTLKKVNWLWIGMVNG